MTQANEVIDGIYAAALDAWHWPEAMRGIGRAIGTRAEALMLADRTLTSRNTTGMAWPARVVARDELALRTLDDFGPLPGSNA